MNYTLHPMFDSVPIGVGHIKSRVTHDLHGVRFCACSAVATHKADGSPTLNECDECHRKAVVTRELLREAVVAEHINTSMPQRRPVWKHRRRA